MSGSSPNITQIALDNTYNLLSCMRHDLKYVYGVKLNDNDDTTIEIYKIELNLVDKTKVSETLLTSASFGVSINIINGLFVSIDESLIGISLDNGDKYLSLLVYNGTAYEKADIKKNNFVFPVSSNDTVLQFCDNLNYISCLVQYDNQDNVDTGHLLNVKLSPALLCMVDRTYDKDSETDISSLVANSLSFSYASNLGSNNPSLDFVVFDNDVLRAISVGDNNEKWNVGGWNTDRHMDVVSVGGYTIATDSYSLKIFDNNGGALFEEFDLTTISYDTSYGIRALSLYFNGSDLSGYGFEYVDGGNHIFKRFDASGNEVASITENNPYVFFTDKAGQFIYALDTEIINNGVDATTNIRVRKYDLNGTYLDRSPEFTFNFESDEEVAIAYGSVMFLNVQNGAGTPSNNALCIEDITQAKIVGSYNGDTNGKSDIKLKDDFLSWSNITGSETLVLFSFV
jgi:hypothetical protein